MLLCMHRHSKLYMCGVNISKIMLHGLTVCFHRINVFTNWNHSFGKLIHIAILSMRFYVYIRTSRCLRIVNFMYSYMYN